MAMRDRARRTDRPGGKLTMRCLKIASLLSLATSFSPTSVSVRTRQFSRSRSSLWPLASSSPPSADAPLRSSRIVQHSSANGTVLELSYPRTGQIVTLVGTAHLSKDSTEQVKSVIESTRPDVVMVELDPTRLERLGLGEMTDLGLPCATANDIIVPPSLLDDDELVGVDEKDPPWWDPLQSLFLDAFTNVGRFLLTEMYDRGAERLGGGRVPGGEFLAAIDAARAEDSGCERIVLGDRSSLVTIRRAGEIALRSRDPAGVLHRLMEINGEEIGSLASDVRKELVAEAVANGEVLDQASMNEAVIERLKMDGSVRERLFTRLEEEVPQFTRAFITERDFIMAEAIRREGIARGARHVVAVVGVAHLPGMAENLQSMVWDDRMDVSMEK